MRKIVFVSRLDADCSLGARALCKIAPQLAEKYPDLEIIIVGGGTEFTKIREQSREINNKINQRLIMAVGNVENPSVYFDKSTLFVGVSRAALEAMAHGLPVILFGDEGQLGLLDDEKLPFAKKTNFTCRGRKIEGCFSVLSDFLFDEICRYFELSSAEKEYLSALSYNVVKNEYTSREMARKTLEIYQKALKKSLKNTKIQSKNQRKIAICGYYGRGNLGDEAILSVIRKNLEKSTQNTQIYVLKNKNPVEISRALCGAECFIFGGGSLLQNATSNASLFYYLAIIHMANLLCKRKIMLANGIGPIVGGRSARKLLEKMMASAINTFDFISVRDTNSQKTLEKFLPNRKINIIPDPALLCEKDEENMPKIAEKSLKNTEKTTKNEKKSASFVYIPCANGLKKSRISAQTVAISLAKIGKAHGLPPVVAVLNAREDLEFASEVTRLLGGVKIVCPKTPNELYKIFLGAEFVISQRYHGSLFAAVCGLPVLCVSSDPKMHAFCKDFGLFPSQSVDIYKNSDVLLEQIDRAIIHHKENIVKINEGIEYGVKKCAKTLGEILK